MPQQAANAGSHTPVKNVLELAGPIIEMVIRSEEDVDEQALGQAVPADHIRRRSESFLFQAHLAVRHADVAGTKQLLHGTVPTRFELLQRDGFRALLLRPPSARLLQALKALISPGSRGVS
jgi:hypothetical protein